MSAPADRPDQLRVVAVLGAGGTMGRGMVRNLREAFEVRAWNRTREKVADLADARVTVCDSAREAAAGADAVLTMLSDGEAVLAAMEG